MDTNNNSDSGARKTGVGGKFTYTYSAEEKDEARRILAAYAPDAEAPDEESSMAQLRALDRATRRPGKMAGWILGTVGVLVMGGGMSMTLTRPTIDAVSVWGIVIGVVGIVLVILAYPLCNRITRRMRERNAPKVRALAERMLDGEDENRTAGSE